MKDFQSQLRQPTRKSIFAKSIFAARNIPLQQPSVPPTDTASDTGTPRGGEASASYASHTASSGAKV